jgi:phage terminase large subunit
VIDIPIELSPPQTAVHKTFKPRTANVIPWGRGVGKSWFIRLCWYLLIAQWDGKLRPGADRTGVRIGILMPTLAQARKVHVQLMLEELAGRWAFLGGRLNQSTWRVHFPGGSWIQFVSAEQRETARGIRCDAGFVDECDDVDIEFYDAVVFPWFSEPHSLAIEMFSGTPTRGRYGLLYKRHRMALDGVPNNYTRHATFREATFRGLPKFVDIARIEEQIKHMDPALVAREWLCDFDAAEGLVYPMFSERVHVLDPHPNTVWQKILVGVDHGYEDPGVYVVMGVSGSGRDATCFVLEEVYRNHEVQSFWIQQAKSIKQRYARYADRMKWYGDPSRPDTIELLRREAHIPIVGADNDINDGVAAVADKLFVRKREVNGDVDTYSKLYVSPSCKNTIKEFGLYRRKRDSKNKDRILEDIEDKNNHAMDALRYAIFSEFGLPPAIKIDISQSQN